MSRQGALVPIRIRQWAGLPGRRNRHCADVAGQPVVTVGRWVPARIVVACEVALPRHAAASSAAAESVISDLHPWRPPWRHGWHTAHRPRHEVGGCGLLRWSGRGAGRRPSRSARAGLCIGVALPVSGKRMLRSRPSVLVVAEPVAEGMGHHPVAVDRGEQVGGRHLTERRSNRRP